MLIGHKYCYVFLWEDRMKHFFAIICLSLILTNTFVAYADDAEEKARIYFDKGVAAYNEGEMTVALEAFQRAYSIRPSFKILYNIGQVEAELKHYNKALDAFEEYLSQGKTHIEEERRLSVDKEIEKLKKLVGSVIIKGTAGSEVWLDGRRIGYLPLAGPIRLDAGSHELILRLGEQEPCQKRINVLGNEQIEDGCWLFEKAQTTHEINVNEEDIDLFAFSTSTGESEFDLSLKKDELFHRKTLPWLFLGLGTATLTAGIICAIVTSSINNRLEGVCTDGICPPERGDDIRRLPRYAASADGLFIASGVISTATILLFISTKKKDKKR